MTREWFSPQDKGMSTLARGETHKVRSPWTHQLDQSVDGVSPFPFSIPPAEEQHSSVWAAGVM